MLSEEWEVGQTERCNSKNWLTSRCLWGLVWDCYVKACPPPSRETSPALCQGHNPKHWRNSLALVSPQHLQSWTKPALTELTEISCSPSRRVHVGWVGWGWLQRVPISKELCMKSCLIMIYGGKEEGRRRTEVFRSLEGRHWGVFFCLIR